MIKYDEMKDKIKELGYYATEELLYDTYNSLLLFDSNKISNGQDIYAVCLDGPPGAGKTEFAKTYYKLTNDIFKNVEFVEYQCDATTGKTELFEDINISAAIRGDADNLIKEAEDKLNDVINSKIIYNNNIINNVTLLDIEQVRHHKLKIFNEFGLKAIMTDFAILLGGYAESGNFSVDNDYRIGSWWLKNVCDEKNAYFVDIEGDLLFDSCYVRTIGIRPVIPYSLIEFDECAKSFNKVLYGEYPQDIVGTLLSGVLESLYQRNELEITGKFYTTDSTHFQNTLNSFQRVSYMEHVYEGQKYIRLVGNSNCAGERLSDKKIIEEGKPYWVKVSPIEWLIDHDTKTIFSKDLLVSGIQFNPKCRDLSFDNSFIYKFLNEIFAKEIIPSKLNNNQKDGLSDESKKVLRRIYREINGF